MQHTSNTLQWHNYNRQSRKVNNYFTLIFTQEDLSSLPELNDYPFPKISHISISVDGVANLLHNLNPHKATGLDGIPAYFLKGCSLEIAPILTLIFQCSLCARVYAGWMENCKHNPNFQKGWPYKHR